MVKDTLSVVPLKIRPVALSTLTPSLSSLAEAALESYFTVSLVALSWLLESIQIVS